MQIEIELRVEFKNGTLKRFKNAYEMCSFRAYMSSSLAERVKACRRIQLYWRMRNGKLAYHLKQQALIFEAEQREEASTLIQALFRGYSDRMLVLRIRNRISQRNHAARALQVLESPNVKTKVF